MDALSSRVLGCLSSVLGVLALLGAAPAFLLGLFALGFNDNGSADGDQTGLGVLGASQWLLYGGLALLLLGATLFVLPWFLPAREAPTQDTSPPPGP